ncbi:hypothetical protein ACIBQ1_14575 [Nonomuraea sp. NPDC050153]
MHRGAGGTVGAGLNLGGWIGGTPPAAPASGEQTVTVWATRIDFR